MRYQEWKGRSPLSKPEPCHSLLDGSPKVR
ncbi:hypothetical protein BCh11DRAFT_03868 [Burkholderia sp. Ch1-1]|nr:hypothetical protein BCh11DRAFT_03868 [Burkholderia sp. Ch1-1]